MDGLSSAIPVRNSAARKVVRRQLHFHLVAGKNPDVVLPHLPRDRRENRVAAVELDAEHRARQGFSDLALDLDFVLLLGQIPSMSNLCAKNTHENKRLARPNYRSKLVSSRRVRILGPSAMTATVCSKWAASDPSSVEIDHSSSCR